MSENYWYDGYSLEGKVSEELDILIKNLQLSKLKKSLDVGCGFGRNLPILLKYSQSVTALDSSQTAIDEIKKRYSGVKTVHADLSDLRTLDEKYDFILAWRILHNGDDKKRSESFQICEQILNENGLLCIAVSSRNCPSYAKRILEGVEETSCGTIKRITSRGTINIRHYFTLREIQKIYPKLNLIYLNEFDEISGNQKLTKKYYAAVYSK